MGSRAIRESRIVALMYAMVLTTMVNDAHVVCMDKHSDIKTRFLSMAINGKDGNECWTWPEAHCIGGYGQFRIDCHPRPAQRIMYEIAIGEVPAGESVGSWCANRACVNPRHLGYDCPSILEERFWNRVVVGEPDECWRWKAYRRKKNNGYFRTYRKQHDTSRSYPGLWEVYGHHFSPRTVAYCLDNDLPLGSTKVAMTCSTDLCVNPAHMTGKPRKPNKTAARLSKGDIAGIYTAVGPRSHIAEKYSCSPRMVFAVKAGHRHSDTTRHLGAPGGSK